MEIKIKGKPEEIKKLLNAMCGSKEQLKTIAANTTYLRKRFEPVDPKVYRQMLLDDSEKVCSNDDS